MKRACESSDARNGVKLTIFWYYQGCLPRLATVFA